MKTGIISVMLAIVLVLIPYPLALAQSSGTITITMTGAQEISITVSPMNWSPGGADTVRPNQEYETNLLAQLQPATYFTLTVAGNCNVNTSIVGGDAECVENSTYKWVLSGDGTNSKRTYVLWFRVFQESSYTLVTKTVSDFCPPHGRNSSLAPTDTAQFGLKLLTPQADFTKGGVGYFSVGGAKMKTTITISAVVAR